MDNIIKECASYIICHREQKKGQYINHSNNIKSQYVIYSNLDEYVTNNKNKRFSELLFLLIEKTGKTDIELYKNAGIDRRLISKIRSNDDYNPSKNTILAVVIALELNKKEADELLLSAGYSLSRSDDYDLAISFFIEKGIYDFYQINNILYQMGFDVFDI